ncbi:phytanoyl-CoA dioxygenase family protein [Novosphingobium lindaniclasticum]|uniref:Phytanoyl-CoA dioxygenase n=1 Tax=Novosphingobium lindaniclasticum LE124 TaxID=1096930 RepID=T0HQ74_9SPHN|nr:phytanoyl-CoA dioxygenase family protein [Novosphingobium lindaniclasticum]EQB14288.1 hypothetical protein L284_12905 [Novosphingobium lindaniclasticum LE124]
MTMLLDIPHMDPLEDATALIGNRAALQDVLRERGYWFFRQVLDQGAVARMRERYLAVLRDMELIAPDAGEPIWNGRSLEGFPEKIEALHDQRAWRSFVAEPEIQSFFTRLLGAAPFWIPSVEYRITPPKTGAARDFLTGRHQDGFANGGIPMLTCWVPLTDIDGTVGGLALAEGLQTGGILHDQLDVPRHRIPDGTIPDDVWHRSDYRPGDLVMFCPEIPHSGMVNHSDRFRLSVDVRVMPIDGELPLVGTVLDIGEGYVRIANHDGRDVRLILDEGTYCRGLTGARIPLPDMVSRVQVGDAVIAAFEGDRAVLLRPQR